MAQTMVMLRVRRGFSKRPTRYDRMRRAIHFCRDWPFRCCVCGRKPKATLWEGDRAIAPLCARLACWRRAKKGDFSGGTFEAVAYEQERSAAKDWVNQELVDLYARHAD